MIMASRLLYGMAKENVVPAQLGIVGSSRRAPWVAILFTTAIAVVLIVTGDLSKLADTTVALLVVVFAIVNVSVLVLRRDRVDHDHFTIPAVFPVLGVGVSIALLTQIEAEIWARAGLLVGLGVVLFLLNALLLRRGRPANA
jgi:amino acid transporter